VKRLALLLLALPLSGCAALREAQQPAGDVITTLRVTAEHAEAGLPLARLACARVRHEDERAACLAVAARVEAAIPKARDILARAEACAGQDDETECLSLAVDAASVVLLELQGEAPPEASP